MTARSEADRGVPRGAPKVSVLIPAYNAGDTIVAAIESVRRQTSRDLELIVVDDGSSDDTADRVLEFSDDSRLRLIQQANTGLAGARNAGLAAARGQYIGLLDSDDLWAPNYLECMVNALDAEPEAGFGYTDAWVLDETTGRVARASALARLQPLPPPSTPARDLLMRLLRRNFVIASTTTIRRSILDQLGGFDPRMPGSEDYELWLRTVASGCKAVRPSGLLAVYRHRNESLSGDDLTMTRSLGTVYRVVADEYDVPEDSRVLARQMLKQVDARIAMLEGRRETVRRALGTRRVLGNVERFLLAPRRWHTEPPWVFAAAFPYLTARSRDRAEKTGSKQ